MHELISKIWLTHKKRQNSLALAETFGVRDKKLQKPAYNYYFFSSWKYIENWKRSQNWDAVFIKDLFQFPSKRHLCLKMSYYRQCCIGTLVYAKSRAIRMPLLQLSWSDSTGLIDVSDVLVLLLAKVCIFVTVWNE